MILEIQVRVNHRNLVTYHVNSNNTAVSIPDLKNGDTVQVTYVTGLPSNINKKVRKGYKYNGISQFDPKRKR